MSDDDLQRHLDNERWPGDPGFQPGDTPGHVDGCFFCGSRRHPTDYCTSPEREAYYARTYGA